MLLAVDVRNRNITLGVFDGEDLLGTFRMTTRRQRTSDEFGLEICALLSHGNVGMDDIDAVIIDSVVPNVMHSLLNSVVKYFNIRPMVVSAGTKTGIRIATENPKEVGPDRIVDAAAAYEAVQGAVIVVDFGTATTYDLIGPDGTFEAAVTAPGIEAAAHSLRGEAAMLPAIEIKKPRSVLAKDTVSSMQAGLICGAIGQTEYIIKKLREESGYTDAKVIATGGLGHIIADETDSIDRYDPYLALTGLRLVYNKNKRHQNKTSQ